MISYILVVLGLILVFVEFYLPGGVLAIAGGVSLLIGMILFVMSAKSWVGALIFIAATLLALAGVIRLALYLLRKGKSGKGFYLNTDQSGYYASSFGKEYLGKKGEAASDLKPSGHVLIEGKRVQAISKTGYITKGSPIVVIGGEGARLVVKQI